MRKIYIACSITLITLFNFLLFQFNVNAEDSQYYENWGWNYDNGTLRIFGENATPDIDPLGELIGREEENLPYYYKHFSEITSLVIENDIKEIGDYGFCDLDYLESITLPNSLVTIGEQSFSSTGVTEITIPKCVQTIEKGAFIGCWQLKLAYVMCRDVDIQEYALGYKTDFSNDKYEDFIIYGYADSTAETYANENGFTFIALDEPISTTTTQTTQTTITSTTLTTTIISSEDPQSTNTSTFVATTTSTSLPIGITSTTVTTSKQTTTITQKVNSDSNGNANNSKVSSSSSPKTGDTFPIAGVLTAIGISAVSTVLFMKKRK